MKARILSEKETIKHLDNPDLWNDLYWEGANFQFPIQLLEVDGRVVGAVQGQMVDDSYYIGYFVMLEKNKGFGQLFVEQLKKDYVSIHGNALPDSISFWKRAGMTFLKSDKEGYHPFEYKAGA